MTDTKTRTGAEDVAWDLTDLYAGPDDPKADQDIQAAVDGSKAFAERYRGRIAELSATEMLEAVQELERISTILNGLGAYSYLLFSTDTSDSVRTAFMQRMREQSAQISTEIVFFTVEWMAVPDEVASKLIADPAVATYRHMLKASRKYKPHTRTEPEEKILTKMSLPGAAAWGRFFSELNSALKVDVDGERIGMEELLSRLEWPDRAERVRAAEAFTETLAGELRTRTFVLNTILLSKSTTDDIREYPTWISERNLSNEASDESVQALVDAVVARYDIPQRYYRLKAKLLGLDRLADYDRNAPIAEEKVEISWDEAKATVLDAYQEFSPISGKIVSDFFSKKWIDAAPRDNKVTGAYCMTTLPGVHPYVLQSFTGDQNSVLTLAHELGHGLHGALATESHGLFNADCPLTLAETASVFGEALTFGRLLDATDDAAGRLSLIAHRIEDAIGTTFRQVAMNRFEHAVHTARREGELSTEDINQHWTQVQGNLFGDSVDITDGYRTWWSYIPHFIHTPGYVYAYAFGFLFSLSIYRRYELKGQEMVDPYLDLLRAGGSDTPEELAKIVGLDITEPDFWSSGLDVVSDLVEDAEGLANKAGGPGG